MMAAAFAVQRPDVVQAVRTNDRDSLRRLGNEMVHKSGTNIVMTFVALTAMDGKIVGMLFNATPLSEVRKTSRKVLWSTRRSP